MPKPKVAYFDFAGSRGEEVRLALVIAGVAFDDNRVKDDDFARIKSDFPFGSLPAFEVPGHGVIVETNAILRLIGRLHHLLRMTPGMQRATMACWILVRSCASVSRPPRGSPIRRKGRRRDRRWPPIISRSGREGLSG